MELSKKILEALENKKAQDVVEIDVTEKTTIADSFIIASGKNTIQVKTLAENVIDALSKEGVEPKHFEGIREGRWAVIDYGDVIVHIFNDENRMFYNLEQLWADKVEKK